MMDDTQQARSLQCTTIEPAKGRIARIVHRLRKLRDRIEPMNKGCIVIDFAGERETIKVTKVIDD